MASMRPVTPPRRSGGHISAHSQPPRTTGMTHARWLSLIEQGRAPSPLELPTEPSLARPVTQSELDRAICNLPCNKAPGSDSIPNEAIKMLPDTTQHHPARATLLRTLNGILCRREVPTEWRQSILVPIPKKVNSQEAADQSWNRPDDDSPEASAGSSRPQGALPP